MVDSPSCLGAAWQAPSGGGLSAEGVPSLTGHQVCGHNTRTLCPALHSSPRLFLSASRSDPASRTGPTPPVCLSPGVLWDASAHTQTWGPFRPGQVPARLLTSTQVAGLSGRQLVLFSTFFRLERIMLHAPPSAALGNKWPAFEVASSSTIL